MHVLDADREPIEFRHLPAVNTVIPLKNVLDECVGFFGQGAAAG